MNYPSVIAAVNHVEPVPRRVRAYLGQQLITGHHPGRAGAARIRWGLPAWRTRQTRGRGMTMVRPRLRRYLRRLLLESLSASGGTIAVASAPPWRASMHACRAQRIVGRQRTLQRGSSLTNAPRCGAVEGVGAVAD